MFCYSGWEPCNIYDQTDYAHDPPLESNNIDTPGACAQLHKRGPKEMPRDERKRQYAAVGRALRSEGNPALLAKWTLSNDLERQAI